MDSIRSGNLPDPLSPTVAPRPATHRPFIHPLRRSAATLLLAAAPFLARAQSHPLLFVTQVPVPADFTTVTATFGNHRPDPDSCARGGDLWIRYPDGRLRNLTQAAGFGRDDDQSTNGIAVREPCVHWDGDRALFSMVVGAPRRQYDYESTATWQIYEISQFLDPAATPVIRRVPGQPANYNNVSPAYATDDAILFTSDQPRSGERHLYPQLDEYEEAPTVTGIWRLDPSSGAVNLLNHTPSGAFSVSVDRSGRVVFVRWDHLQRDQQADADAAAPADSPVYGTFDFSDESAAGAILRGQRREVFPEPRLGAGRLNGHTFNQFFPWQINEDGTEEETLNHVGRHELGGSYRSASFTDDPNLGDLYFFGDRYNTNAISNFLQIRESPVEPGVYYGIDAPEFGTHAAGQIIALESPAGLDADHLRIRYVTARATSTATPDEAVPDPGHSGLYRNPLPLSDGSLVAVHTAETRGDRDIGSDGAPKSRYDFRLKRLVAGPKGYVPEAPLTPGLRKTVRYWSPDALVTHSDAVLWELDPVEVYPRPRPAPAQPRLAGPEREAFEAEGVAVDAFSRALRTNGLALIVSRNLTTRDRADFQQPFNLRVPGGIQTTGAPGRIYDVSHLQIFQADQVRGLGLTESDATPRPGRRVLARPLHDLPVPNPPIDPGAPAASVRLGLDGSMAALVPARRALTWQLTDPTGEGVVRERYWVTMQPGEIRTCTSCHGINTHDQAGQPTPTNSPQALRDLLRHWKATTGGGAPAETPRFLAPVLRPDGRLALAAVVNTNLPTRLEESSDLHDWTPLFTSPAGQSTFEHVLDPGEARRFYRLRQ